MINRDGTQKILKVALFAIIVVIVIIYSFFSFRDYIEGPKIIINEPLNGSTFSTSTVTIKGQVLRIQDVTLNNKPILIDTAGNFSEVLMLLPGYNVSLISAKDKFNRTIEYKLEFVYQDK